jgi:hypothetical protein
MLIFFQAVRTRCVAASGSVPSYVTTGPRVEP